MFTHWYVNLLLIKELEKLRDSLLPKLLSGEIRSAEFTEG
jgi:hypothetical protein